MFTGKTMDLLDLTPQQLKRAAAIKEQMAALNKELSQILDNSSDGALPRRKHERIYEKKDCRCAESTVGERATC